jgi:intracellular sulfur oxidation DsrE/DsrF family protein
MKFGKYLAAAALLVAATLPLGASAQGTAPAKTKVVFQVSDGDSAKWGLALNNANNVQQELGAGKVEIEIVAYGPGIGMLKADATTANRIAEAVHNGVKVVACENTMRAQKLSKEDMNTTIGYVPAGVVEIIRRQNEGWAYIRP